MSDLVGNPEDRFSRVAAHIFVLPTFLDCDMGVLAVSVFLLCSRELLLLL